MTTTATEITVKIPDGWALRSFKHFKAGSEETPNFVANLWIDGKKAAEVRNDGRGGCNYYYWQPGFNGADIIKQAEEFTGEKFEPLDAIIYNMMDEIDLLKQAKRFAKKGNFPIVVQASDKAGEFLFGLRDRTSLDRILDQYKATDYRIVIGG